MIRIKLKAVLAEKGIKQKDLVEMTGIRQPTLSGMNNNSVKHIRLMCWTSSAPFWTASPPICWSSYRMRTKKPGRLTHPGRRRVISCDACSRSEGCAAPL